MANLKLGQPGALNPIGCGAMRPGQAGPSLPFSPELLLLLLREVHVTATVYEIALPAPPLSTIRYPLV